MTERKENRAQTQIETVQRRVSWKNQLGVGGVLEPAAGAPVPVAGTEPGTRKWPGWPFPSRPNERMGSTRVPRYASRNGVSRFLKGERASNAQPSPVPHLREGARAVGACGLGGINRKCISADHGGRTRLGPGWSGAKAQDAWMRWAVPAHARAGVRGARREHRHR